MSMDPARISPAMTRHPRVLICDPRPEAGNGLVPALTAAGYDVVPCPDGEAMIECVIANAPAAIVYWLRQDPLADIAVLQLLRRVARETPLILLASDGSVATRLSLHPLRPTYFAVAPVDDREVIEALASVIGRKVRAS